METKRLVIINTGLRPITIDQVFISVNIKNHGPYDAMPKKAFWSDAEDHKPPRLPFTLEDGRMAVFYVSEFVNEQLRLENSFLKIQVYDAEGNIYTKYTKGQYDPKLRLRFHFCFFLVSKISNAIAIAAALFPNSIKAILSREMSKDRVVENLEGPQIR